MGNLHAVAASAVSVPSTAEIVVATMTAFNENTPAPSNPSLGNLPNTGAQGVYLGGAINITAVGAATATIRLRQGSLTGALVGVAQVNTLAAGIALGVDICELDPTFVQFPAIYVVTVQLSTSTATVNRVIFTAEDATSFE
jgi:hypothetical protein